ncbi:hypothetical protein [Hymenobacter cellulosilyticus]|uniref:Uncharacterized protein n=1 Tax=Hymenobacter cellulosilyticus TaxID=2932248 RepID=A0A8T9PZJ4_9BACT|nr:hypothetical protein [Hymenobacter cellulosilyticus]UOQ69982.1 hypothetical protein MUN79_14395 [Hymenobacter cellulosilyticus]
MSGPTKSEGVFELRFKTEKSFQHFGQQYLRCYGNLGLQGKLSAPDDAGQLTYTIGFQMDCGCQSVLGKFRKAYDKTFPTPGAAPAPGPDRDWTGQVLFCKVVPPAAAAPHRGFTHRIAKAANSTTTTLVADLARQPWLNGYALGNGTWIAA